MRPPRANTFYPTDRDHGLSPCFQELPAYKKSACASEYYQSPLEFSRCLRTSSLSVLRGTLDTTLLSGSWVRFLFSTVDLELMHSLLTDAGSHVTFLLRNPDIFAEDEAVQKHVQAGTVHIVKGDALNIDNVHAAWAEAIKSGPVTLVLFTVGFSTSRSSHFRRSLAKIRSL